MKKNKYLLVGMVLITLVLSTAGSFGSTIVDNKNAEIFRRYPASMGAVLEVTTDKTVYNLGEPVTIFLTNVGDETLSGGGPIITIYDEEEEIVYQEATYCWHELEPGEYIEWPPWDQTNQQGQQVPVGEYVVEGFLSGGGENYVDNATFFIINYNPPGPPSGPNEGVVGEEYTFCFELSDNPECEPYYVMWDWGDGTMSEWSGPYVAGETVCANHSWNEPGDYEVRVGIKDGCSNEYWSDPLTITIHINTGPELEITDILGGFGVTALIAARNISAETLHWSFTFDGGIILLPVGRIKEGTSHCYAESEATTFVLGIGMVDITVFVEARGEANVTKTVSGLVLGPFVIMQQE